MLDQSYFNGLSTCFTCQWPRFDPQHHQVVPWSEDSDVRSLWIFLVFIRKRCAATLESIHDWLHIKHREPNRGLPKSSKLVLSWFLIHEPFSLPTPLISVIPTDFYHRREMISHPRNNVCSSQLQHVIINFLYQFERPKCLIKYYLWVSLEGLLENIESSGLTS